MTLKDYISLIKRSGEKLNQIRDSELRATTSFVGVFEAMSEPFAYALQSQPPAASSGLVEFQRIITQPLRK